MRKDNVIGQECLVGVLVARIFSCRRLREQWRDVQTLFVIAGGRFGRGRGCSAPFRKDSRVGVAHRVSLLRNHQIDVKDRSFAAMKQQQWLIIGAFFCTYVIWGSTYLANYWAIQSIPVFGMGASRFLVAGLLLYLLSLFVGNKTRPTLRQWGNATIQGVLFLAIGVGAVVWAQQYIPTSTTALIISFEPLLVMLLMWGWFKNRPPVKAFIGAGISILGMSLLIQEPASFSGPDAAKGLAGILFGMSCWAVGIVLGSKLDMGENKFRATGMQMLMGGLLLFLFSLVVNDWEGWSVSQVTRQSLLAWLFLVTFGAIIAFSAFNFLLRTVSADMAATNTYVNPVVAVLLGGLLNNETITGQMLLAGALLLTGVYFINSAKRKQPPAGEAA